MISMAKLNAVGGTVAAAADHHFLAVKVPDKGDLLHFKRPLRPSFALVSAVEQERTVVDAHGLGLFCSCFLGFLQFFRGQLEKFMAGIGIPAGGTHNGIGIGIIHRAADHAGPAGQTEQRPDRSPILSRLLGSADHRHFLGMVDNGVLPVVAKSSHCAVFGHHNAGDPVVGTAAGGK